MSRACLLRNINVGRMRQSRWVTCGLAGWEGNAQNRRQGPLTHLDKTKLFAKIPFSTPAEQKLSVIFNFERKPAQRNNN